MKTLFTLKPLAVVVAAAIGLAGCNSESQVASSPDATQEQKTASVKLAAKFPAPEAGAAWIGSASEIEIDFYRNQYVGSLSEAEDMLDAYHFCQEENYKSENQNQTVMVGDEELECYELPNNGMKERFAVAASLSASSPTASVNLMPGKYRVEAHFYDAQGGLRETSVSYVTFTEGEHQVALKGVSATWTAQTPIALSLLNQAHEKDWDPETEGVQTPAEAMGLTGNILGLHLPSLFGYSGPLGEELELDDGEIGILTGNMTNAKASAALLVPVWRIQDGTGETDLHPQANQDDYDMGYMVEPGEVVEHLYRHDTIAGLYQQYAAGENSAFIELGTKEIEIFSSDWSDEEQDSPSRMFWNASVLMGVAHVSADEDEEVERNAWYMRNITYWDADIGQNVDTGIQVLDVGTWQEQNNYEKTFLDVLQGSANSFVGGNTINGFFIEVVEKGTESDGAEMPAQYLDASLNEVAVQAGLLAKASESCHELTNKEVSFSNQYRWDEENSRWVAGTTNELLLNAYSNLYPTFNSYRSGHQNEIDMNNLNISYYQAEIDSALANGASEADVQWLEDLITSLQNRNTLELAAIDDLNTLEAEFNSNVDLNEDGTATLFEDGVFYAEGYSSGYCYVSSQWNSEQQINSYSLNCEGVSEAVTEVMAYTTTTTATMCIQPFTLEASELAIDYGTDGGVIVE
ncbi:hypothetical protein [Vibrio navarrensis]|uniref:Lipoprotein n=1 Tax=Vibrio navarrensis TaxID=29495 RepID=A0A099LS73_9VIBR|nr:hypothetical protein [Vibrio navarrensis]KGK10147.1 hypothetical protein EA26_01990 [Vibrio navarrensis]MBE4616864.1 hypothetical protein [Vibrio navarrensis]QOD69872.1 hypothetical protein IF132_14055 [Vibrio navarrensis]